MNLRKKIRNTHTYIHTHIPTITNKSLHQLIIICFVNIRVASLRGPIIGRGVNPVGFNDLWVYIIFSCHDTAPAWQKWSAR